MEGSHKEFKCVRCGACCRWEGPVRLRGDEPDRIASHLQMPVLEFIEKYARIAPDRVSLSLEENPDGSCVFFDASSRSCLINDAKPEQCVGFPVEWSFPGWDSLCGAARGFRKEP